MKYDAKCLSATTSQPLTAPDYSTPYHVYYNQSQPCVAPNFFIASTPTGYPITDIKQSGDSLNNDAVKYCQSIGAHLITNNEWQTIAWNAQQQPSNWSVGSVGLGTMGRGNSDSSFAAEASLNDADADYLTGYSDFLHRRTLALSNGQTIWDMAGNILQWTNDTILGTSKPVGGGGGPFEWFAVSNFGAMTQTTAGPYNNTWGSVQGIGEYYQGNADAVTYSFIRGGFWGNGGPAGVEMLLLGTTPDGMHINVGFRCAR
jgi:formylglycine-generating enzyme required for sulfatase activity